MSETNNPVSSHADITILLDRSASMIPLRKSAVDSLNQHFAKMREMPGDTRWSMAQFDDPDSARGAKEEFPNIVFSFRSEQEMVPLKMEDFKPRGSTALVDAVCKTIQNIDSRVSGQENCIQPVLMILTDGLENMSKEYTSAQMREIVADRQSRGWEVLYIGANQDAWQEAKKYSFDKETKSQIHDFTGGSILSGAVVSGALCAFSYEATSKGLSEAITSGIIGCFHFASGVFARTHSSVS